MFEGQLKKTYSQITTNRTIEIMLNTKKSLKYLNFFPQILNRHHHLTFITDENITTIGVIFFNIMIDLSI